MSEADKRIKVFVPGGHTYYHGVKELEHIINSQVEAISEEALEADHSLGTDIKVGFYCGNTYGSTMLKYKEQGQLPKLELACNHGVGVNHLPFDRMKSLGIRATNTPDVLSDSTADLALGLMLASGRRFGLGMDIAMRRSGAEKSKLWAELTLGQEISHSTVGIVGMGSIGYKIAQRAKAFNMNILYHSRSQRSAGDEAAVGATYHSDLLAMLPSCDYVVIACPLTTETKHMFKCKEFKAMKPSAHLVNIARGGIVDTDSLVEALRSKEIFAAALDVTDPEPLPDHHPLLSLDSVIIVPHWGSATIQTRGKMIQLMIDNAKAFIEGKPLLTEVHF